MSLETTFAKLMKDRRSVRAFKSDPVPQALLDKVFSVAMGAPSNCNTQPWRTFVASGEACEKLRKGFPEKIAAGEFQMDFPYAGNYSGEYKERQYDAAAQLYSALGIAREDKATRNEWFQKNFTFFGAPHAVFFFIHESFGIHEAGDVGMFAQSLMLSARAHGLATCPQTALSFHGDLVRDVLGVPPELKLLFGMSLGYEDTESPANDCRVARAPLDQIVTFVNSPA